MLHVFFKAIAIWIMVFCTGSMVYATPPESKKPLVVHVGIYAPFSDEQAFIGRNMLGAMEEAREASKDNTIQYIFYTLDALPSQGAEVVRVVQHFIEMHHLNVLVTEGTSNGLMIAPLAKKNKIIHFSLAGESGIADGQHNFLALNSELEHKQLPASILKQKEIKKVALASADVFTLLHQSIVASGKKERGFSVAAVAQKIQEQQKNMG